MEVGNTLIAIENCSIQDGTTEGNRYKVSKIERVSNGRLYFYIINDEGKEVMPESTVFEISR